MGTFLVTGATGFIGSRLVAALSLRGDRVRALQRRGKGWTPSPPPGMGWESPESDPLRAPQVEWWYGDITAPDSLRRAAQGCDGIFHLAASAKNYDPDPTMFHRMNVGGLRNVLDAAETVGVGRVVWSSSCVTLGPTRPGQVLTENEPRITEICFNEYERTKVEAEGVATEFVRRGVPVVIVNPTRVFGPGYLTESNSVTILIDEYSRWMMPFLPRFGRCVGNWVFVEDVVRGMIAAMEKGRIGQRYLLGGDNATLAEFFGFVDQASGKRHLRIPLGTYIPLGFSYLQLGLARTFGIYPRITPGWIRMFCAHAAYRCDKAKEELGYLYTPVQEAVRITWEWILRTRAERRLH
ncbi:MAG: NAD-dependent epimerase/dehydratase family protein [Planctomycetia bacterium]|nr:NAD-dependent epimerase/dehydratase family protein [Planctomycetia bacterium]